MDQLISMNEIGGANLLGNEIGLQETELLNSSLENLYGKPRHTLHASAKKCRKMWSGGGNLLGNMDKLGSNTVQVPLF